MKQTGFLQPSKKTVELKEYTMEERKKILNLLEEGKITTDEAVKLLEAVQKSYGHINASFGHSHHHLHPHKLMRKIHNINHGFGPGRKMIIIKHADDCGCHEDIDCCCDED